MPENLDIAVICREGQIAAHKYARACNGIPRKCSK